MNHIACAIAVLLGLSLAGSSWAARPLSTEDAEPLAAGDCELEGGLTQQRTPGEARERSQLVQLGCGIGLGTQVALQWQGLRAGESNHVAGVLGKTRLAGDDDGPAYALAWGHASLRNPAHTWHADSSYLTGIVSWPLAETLTLHGNLGWVHDHPGRRDRTQWGLALEHRATSHTDVMAEVFDDDRSRAPWLQLGLRWNAVPERLWLDAGSAWQAGSAGARAYSVGVRLAF